MNNWASFPSLFAALMFLAGCANAPPAPVSPATPASGLGSAELPRNDELEARQREDRAKREQLAASFYDEVPPCEQGPFTLKDLRVGDVRISYSEVSSIATTLKTMGYSVIDLQGSPSAPSLSYQCDELPVVVVQSRPADLKLSFESFQTANVGSTAVNSLGNANAADIDNFLVYYHPSQSKAFEKVSWLVRDRLDTPSPQVYIETMVLEVREEDSSEFGVDYQKSDGDKVWSLGSLAAGTSNTADFVRDTLRQTEDGVKIFTPGFGKRVRLKALIDEGKAEVLSRPSILALSNRQAVIQVVDVIQSAELSSTLSGSGDLQISAYHFTPLLIGITLNLRPRVSADRSWLTLEIDATVEAEDDENSGEVFASTDSGDSVLLAEKQGSNSKRVKTFARIPDRTPIIIGGLVSSKMEELESKVPLIGAIPGVGKLFSSKDKELQKREIIIVLTPYILAEDSTGIGTRQPGQGVLERASNAGLLAD